MFVSYSHDSPAHMDRVLALCDRLRHDGVDADLDQYEAAPPEGWPRWTLRQIEAADFVLVVCTETYRRRFDGREEKRRGLAVHWEGAVITQVLYDASAETRKLVPVIFTPEDEAHIPTVLRGTMYYNLGTDAGYEQLYRHLTRQPEVPKPELGALVALPPKPRASGFAWIPLEARGRPRWPWRAVALLVALLALAGYVYFRPAGGPEGGTATKQTLSIEILDAETKLPLPGVLVSLPDLDLAKPTGQDGKCRFEVAEPAGAPVHMRAVLKGYKMIREESSVGSLLNQYRMWRDR